MVIGTSNEEIAAGILQRFPITGSLPEQRIDSGHSFWVGVPEVNGNPGFRLSLNKTAPPDEMGRFDAGVSVVTKEALAGFRGCLEIRLMDDRGNVVYAVMTSPQGVNGTAVPGAPSEDYHTDTGYIPLVVLAATAQVELLARRGEGPALDDLQRTVSEIQAGVGILKDGIEKIGADIATIAAIIQAA